MPLHPSIAPSTQDQLALANTRFLRITRREDGSLLAKSSPQNPRQYSSHSTAPQPMTRKQESLNHIGCPKKQHTTIKQLANPMLPFILGPQDTLTIKDFPRAKGVCFPRISLKNSQLLHVGVIYHITSWTTLPAEYDPTIQLVCWNSNGDPHIVASPSSPAHLDYVLTIGACCEADGCRLAQLPLTVCWKATVSPARYLSMSPSLQGRLTNTDAYLLKLHPNSSLRLAHSKSSSDLTIQLCLCLCLILTPHP